MWRLISRFFSLYMARHLHLQIPAKALPQGPGLQILSTILKRNVLEIQGQSDAPQVFAHLAGVQRMGQPDQVDGHFVLRLPYASGRAEVWAEVWAGSGFSDNPTQKLYIPRFSKRQVFSAKAGLLPRLLRRGFLALPTAVRWLHNQDLKTRTELRSRLGLAPLENIGLLDSGLLKTRKTTNSGEGPANTQAEISGPWCMVMPVYDAFEVLQEALERVRCHTQAPWHLILIEDCSSDPRIRPFLRQWAQVENQKTGVQVTLLENRHNLGFIGATNRGLKQALVEMPGMKKNECGAVVLLNSDALVPKGWAGRLLGPIWADGAVASVTPMSNNAELLTVPQISQHHKLAPGFGDQIDGVARRLNVPPAGIGQMPTGVGFCMAMSVSFLHRVGLFDPDFGQGYGEEVDWCQRALALGGRHVAQPGLFVEHRGGASFGSEQKQRLLRENGALLRRRYSQFDQQVQDFIADDPLLNARMVLGLATAEAEAARRGTSVSVYLGHSLGGGAEMVLAQKIKKDLDKNGAAIVVRVGGRLRWLVEVHLPAGLVRGQTDNTDMLQQLVELLPSRRICYSCGVGGSDLGSLPGLLLKLAKPRTRGIGGIEVMFHDYLPLSPSYTLLGGDGVYHGVPMPDNVGKDPAHMVRRADGTLQGLGQWRATWGGLIAAADRLEVFSESSRALVLQAYPQARDKIVVVPHQAQNIAPFCAPLPNAGAGPVIGVLGNMAPHKGAGVVEGLSNLLVKPGLGRLVLLGDLDPNYRLVPPAIVHGNYQVSDLAALARYYKIECWLVPSIWPETFSFTTHEALATGLPVLAFDLGAQGDLVTKTPNGWVVPLQKGAPDLGFMLDLARRITQKKS